MKTFRTVVATLAGVLLFYALFAFISVKNQAAFVQRTIYQGFDQSFVVALVLGVAFLLIAIIFTVAIATTREEQEDEEEEPFPAIRTAKRKPAEKPSLLDEDEEEDVSVFTKPTEREAKPMEEAEKPSGRKIFCIYCGKAVEEQAALCPHCGRRL